ncbi:MAG: membrane protein insertase YidC [Phenylobacterium sp.]|uniref:membrane protein insertase YidC n=1 Tax=Phenylobacterium sp. TaxID=1871053 RepID=UPI00391CBC7E
MQNENTRNTIIFVVSAVIILIVYQFLVIEPAAKRRQAEAERAAAAAPVAPGTNTVGAPDSLPATAAQLADRATVVATTPRVPVATPALSGSIALRGARIDDLFLTDYRTTVDADAPPVELLRPEGAEHAWFAEFGWTGANLAGLPTPDTRWTVVEGERLAPDSPITLRYSNGQGLTFTRQIAVDDRYMFTVTDTVANTGASAVTLAPYASVQRQGVPDDLGRNQIVHEGAVGWLGDELRLVKYKKWAKDGGPEVTSTGGWLGITDKYWLAALVPNQDEQIKGEFRVTDAGGGLEIFEANYVGQPHTIAPGRQITETTRLFAGAKTVPVLKAYERNLDIPRLDNAVDWGNFWFFTRPLFSFLHWLYQHIGNVGLAILALTVVVKLVFFPLANKSYESLTKMKKVQPQIEELRKKYKDDPAKQQQELLGLYQKEKINPLTGCLPMLLQIPVFYALYKVLTVTIEMRHAPFYGWIQDLSARDPTTIFNLFGAIPWDPSTAPLIGSFLNGPLHLGVLPLLYGFTMWLTTAMNPPAGDPIQQRIFQLMPIMFTFIMAPFAAGLLIYWTWNNVLTIIQQYIIMRRFKVDNPIDSLIGRFTGKKAAG